MSNKENQTNDEKSKLFLLTEKILNYPEIISDNNCEDCKNKENNKLEETKICICDCCNADRIKNYGDYFKFAIESDEVKNLAVLGEYGVGKSSIFKSFLHHFENKKYKNSFLDIEVGQYHKNNTNKDDKNINIENNSNDFSETKYVQKQILIQLATQVKSKNIRFSNYNLSLFNLKRWQIFLLVILILITIIFSTFFSISLIDYIKNANETTQALVKPNEAQLGYNWTQGWSLTTIIIFGIISILLIGSICVVLIRYLNKIKFKFSFLSQKIEMEFDREGIFQETDIRISEILNIFKKLWKKEGKFIYVFEDIDRFGNTFILQKLKELNKNINNFLKNNKSWIDELDRCPRIKKFLKHFEKWIKHFQIFTCKSNYYPKKIIFVYLANPNLFALDKGVKFFDLIIPIVPITSQGKAKGFWTENFYKVIQRLEENKNKKLLENYGLWNLVDKDKYFLVISEIVYDIRSILHILNEFEIYLKIYSNLANKSSNLEITIFRLLSFIIFKNAFYFDYKSIWNLLSEDEKYKNTKVLINKIENHKDEDKDKTKTSYLDLVWKEIESIKSKYNHLKKMNKEKLKDWFDNPNQLNTFDYDNDKWDIDIYYFLNFVLSFSYKAWDFSEKFESYLGIFDKHLGILNFFLPNKLHEFSIYFFRKLSYYNDDDENYHKWCYGYPFIFADFQTENNKDKLDDKQGKYNKSELDEKNIKIEDNKDKLDYAKIVEFMEKVNETAGLDNIISPNIIFDFSSLDPNIINFGKNYVLEYLKHQFSIKRLKYEILYKEIIEEHFEDKTNWTDEVSIDINLSVIFLKLINIDFKLTFINGEVSIDKESLSLWFVELLIDIQNEKNKKIIQNIFWILPPIGQWILLVCVDISYNKIREGINITFVNNNDDIRYVRCLHESKIHYVSTLLDTAMDNDFDEGRIKSISNWVIPH